MYYVLLHRGPLTAYLQRLPRRIWTEEGTSNDLDLCRQSDIDLRSVARAGLPVHLANPTGTDVLSLLMLLASMHSQ